MTEQHDRRLIEDSLPLEAISFQSAREKSIRHGHISTLHIWWARRPLAAMRAAIFAALMPAPKDEEERDQMHRLIGGTYNAEKGKWEGGICDWDSVKNGNDGHIEQAQALIRKHYPDAPPKVLDPFMGGGSTGLEALRLGAEAHGVELNPVAHIIELCTLVYPQKYGQKISREDYEARPGTLPPVEHMAAYVDDEIDEDENSDPEQQSFDFDSDEMINPLAEDVKRWSHWVLEKTREEIGYLYDDPTKQGTIVGYLWARTAKCPNPTCRAEMPMARQWWLVKKPSRKLAISLKVDDGSKSVKFEIVEDDEIDFDPSQGTIRRGSIQCPVCGQSPDTEYLRSEGLKGRLGERPLVIVYTEEGKSGKSYRLFTTDDSDIYVDTKSIIEKHVSLNANVVPQQEIPLMSGTFNVPIYGFDKWHKLFNSRQLLSLVTLADKIQQAYVEIAALENQEYGKAIATYLALILDRIADYNSTLCTWHNTGEKINHTFGRQALPMIWDYFELNPFSGSTGDWTGATEWVVRVIEHATRTNTNSATLTRGDATRLPYRDKELDVVVTDPPYYNAVPYADLSDFFYVWMKQSLDKIHPDIFATPLSPKANEITEMAGWDSTRYANKDKAFYETQMTKAFYEAQRVLLNDGIFTVVFAHKSTSAWETLINSLLSADLVVTASWPLHTEMGARLRAQNSGALASSIFIVCRKRIAQADGVYDDVRPRIKERIKERLDYFWKQGIRGADFFISAIGPAVEVFGQYKTVRKLSGDVVTVAELLDIVQQEVADYALSQVMNGGSAFGPFDAPTRFYIMYRWSYGKNKIEFDDGMRLAMALGAEVDLLMHVSSVLKKSGSSVTLLSPYDREDNEKLGEPARDRMSAPLIDMVHRAALLWRAGKRDELARFVSANVGTRVEALRAVAQALVNVLPDGDKEKQLYEGFLQGELPTAPTSHQMFSDDQFES